MEQQSPSDQLMKWIAGKWISKPIFAAAELGIADLLDREPMTLEQLARETGCHGPSLYRMMRALAGLGIFRQTRTGQFVLTPMGECLKSGRMRSIARMFNADWNDRAWAYFMDTLKTGETAFDTAHGMPLFRWLDTHPEAADLLNRANAVKSAGLFKAAAAQYDFSSIRTLVDVGGGTGTLMADILTAYASMNGVIADTPGVVRNAADIIRDRDLENRCQTVACDFFRHIPEGRDGYLLSNILHDWPDDQCRRILSNCRQAMKPDSTLLVIEMPLPAGNGPAVPQLLDLEMMVMTGGRERTREAYTGLLEDSGFRVSQVIPGADAWAVFEARPVPG